jgi:hypothetical protein
MPTRSLRPWPKGGTYTTPIAGQDLAGEAVRHCPMSRSSRTHTCDEDWTDEQVAVFNVLYANGWDYRQEEEDAITGQTRIQVSKYVRREWSRTAWIYPDGQIALDYYTSGEDYDVLEARRSAYAASDWAQVRTYDSVPGRLSLAEALAIEGVAERPHKCFVPGEAQVVVGDQHNGVLNYHFFEDKLDQL